MRQCIATTFIACALLIGSAHGRAAAQTEDARRSLWEYSGGYVKLSRHWQQKTGGKVYDLVETARNKVFVDLFDPARHRSFRLYDGKFLYRDVDQADKPDSIWLTKRADGHWDNGSARSKWTYAGGSFESIGPAWFEPAAHGVNMFIERARDGDHIDLDDAQRNFTVRLSDHALQIRGGKYTDFTRLYDGGWVAPARPAKITFKIDARDAPEAKTFALLAKALAETWYPIIVERLSPNDKLPPKTYTIIVKHLAKKGTPAFTRNGDNRSITFSADYIKGHPRDYGMIAHELTHVVENYNFKKSKNTYWLSEGIADFIRNYEFEPESRRDIKPDTSFRKGYRTAAGFLAWIARTYDRRAVEKLNFALQQDIYSEAMFQELTGRSLDALWDEFRKQHHAGKQPPKPVDTPEPEE